MKEKIPLRQKLQRVYFHIYSYQKSYLEGRRYKNQLSKKIKKLPLFKEIVRDKKYLSQCKEFLNKNFNGYNNIDAHIYYSTLSGRKEIGFISNELFFNRIEPILNTLAFKRSYVDKISYDLIFPKKEMPRTILKIIKAQYFDSNNKYVRKKDAIKTLIKLNETVVIKPSVISGSGKGIKIKNSGKIAELLKSNLHYNNSSFIIQERASQHPEMEKYHPSSLNTCRIMTARVGNKIVLLGSNIRIGVGGSRIDNTGAGGLMCKIDEDGKLGTYAYDKEFNSYLKHPDSGIKFDGFLVPNFQNILTYCLDNHKRFLRFTFISWDIGIKRSGDPIFIEFNLKSQAIYGHQFLSGPIFGKYTDEILNKYKELRSKDSFYI